MPGFSLLASLAPLHIGLDVLAHLWPVEPQAQYFQGAVPAWLTNCYGVMVEGYNPIHEAGMYHKLVLTLLPEPVSKGLRPTLGFYHF